MTDIVSVRAATAKDIDVFLQLVDGLADYEELPRPNAEGRARLVRDGFTSARPRFEAFLGELDGRPVGYAIIFETYSSFLALPTLYLEDIFVLPEARKQKVGYALFMHCVREAVRRGCGRMEWTVLDWNQIAHDFYAKLGAKRLTGWEPYRLTSEELTRLASC